MSFDCSMMEPRPVGANPERLSLRVRMPDGRVLSLTAATGARLLDEFVDFGIPIHREARDREPHAGCRVRLRSPWSERLPAPDAQERAILAASGAGDSASRLLSRVIMTPDLDGLELELSWDALVAQTYWAAG